VVQTSHDQLRRRLEVHQQGHLLRFWDELSSDERTRLAEQIERIDLELIDQLVRGEGSAIDWQSMAERAQPPAAFRLNATDNRFSRGEAKQAGEALLAAGKVGAVLVAGGQGTRLGFPHPKGMFPLGPVSNRSLFQMHVDQLRAVAARYQTRIPLLLMTSPATHEETVAFFQRHSRFGLPAEDLHVFCQGTMPAVDDRGRLLLAAKDQIFLSPDGHGGMLAALQTSGGLDELRERGLEQLFYFQVDNPLISICDRELLGFHALAESEMSSVVVAKQEPMDRVGNVVSIDGRLLVIEYSDLPLEAAERRDAQGRLLLWAGSIAVHVFRRDFLERVAGSRQSLPFHLARKVVAYVNDDGETILPDEANATKFERFIFDLMPLANNAVVVEGEEREIFAPLKNASGEAKDTPETARAALAAKFARWLNAAGGEVVEGAVLEIGPRVALDADELRGRVEPGMRIGSDTFLP
jgi:UDP-N-acetylglucosamine/UDP-N-acetylgalactosamine diphosphorylase